MYVSSGIKEPNARSHFSPVAISPQIITPGPISLARVI